MDSSSISQESLDNGVLNDLHKPYIVPVREFAADTEPVEIINVPQIPDNAAIANFDLSVVLQESADGESIIAIYKLKQYLNLLCQNRLCQA